MGKYIIALALPVAKFLPEYRGHFITAKVTKLTDGKVAADVECFLSFPAILMVFMLPERIIKEWFILM